MNLRCLVFFTFAFAVQQVFPQNGSQCATPRSTEGECVPIKQCFPLLSILQTPPLTPQAMRYLRRSQCGFDETVPLVCCPTSEDPRPFRLIIRPPVITGNIENRFGEEGEKCGLQYSVDKKFEGIITDLTEFPWMARLVYENRDTKTTCGGVLINDRWVLTSAQCVSNENGKNGKPLKVRLGEYDLQSEQDCDFDYEDTLCSPTPLEIDIRKIHIHPRYNSSNKEKQHDIALIELSHTVNFTDYISPICLPNKDIVEEIEKSESLFTVAGWGEHKAHEISLIKQKALLREKTKDDCNNFWNRVGVKVTKDQICAGGMEKEACRGDSGGSLMAVVQDRWYSLGVFSLVQETCGKQGEFGVYTRTSAYIQWIRDTVAG